MNRLSIAKSLLVSAAALSAAAGLPSVAAAHDHHRDRHDQRVEYRPTVLIRAPRHARPARPRTVVVHEVRTRTIVVRQPVYIHKTVIVRQPVRTVYVHDTPRPVYRREPVRTVYVRPQPVAVRYVTQAPVRIIYQQDLDWSAYQRSRSTNHFHHDYRHDLWRSDAWHGNAGQRTSGQRWSFGNWHW